MEPTYLGVYLARERGHFESLGLDVEIVESSGANTAAATVAAGRYPIGTASRAATVTAVSRGASLVSTAVYQGRRGRRHRLVVSGIGTPGTSSVNPSRTSLSLQASRAKVSRRQSAPAEFISLDGSAP